MKSLLIGAALLFAALAHAQNDAIRVTTTLRPDGSRVDRQVNPAENELVETTYAASGEVTQKFVFKTDEAGNPMSGTAFDAKGTKVMKIEYTRDASGRITEQLESTPGGDVIRRLVYEYDPVSARLSGIKTYDAKGNLLKKR